MADEWPASVDTGNRFLVSSVNGTILGQGMAAPRCIAILAPPARGQALSDSDAINLAVWIVALLPSAGRAQFDRELRALAGDA